MTSLKILTIICMVLVSLSFISAISITDVTSSPTQAAQGDTVSITLEIENIFNNEVTDLNVKLILDETPFAPHQSTEKSLSELDSDEKEDFKFRLIVLPETASGIYTIPVKITYEYKDENSTIQSGEKEDLISITVNSEPELKLSLEEGVLIKGKENEFSIKIVNSGLADVKFVYLRVSDAMGIKILYEKEQYIGDIDSDDFDAVKYKAYISKSAKDTINLPVILKYKDATNKEFTESKTISLRIYSLKEAQSLGLAPTPSYTYYIVGFVVVLGYFTYRWRKKKRLRKLREAR